MADIEALTLVKSELQKRHTCTDLGEQRSYLGLQITRDRARRTITLTHSHMVHQVIQRFGFQYSSPQLTPLSTSHSLSAPPSNESVEPSGPYPELVGCLIYLMTCTRPDLAYPLNLGARYVAPGSHRKVHWDAAKRVLRYLCSTSGMGLVLGGRGPVVLTGHADASWVDDSATQRSSQGYTFSLGSGSVSWRSTRSSSVLSSCCEAQIYAGAMAAQEVRWLTYLLPDLGEQPRSPPFLYVDNKAMIALCQEHRLEHRTKHIALRYFLARELQQRGQLRLAYVATQANTADVFTKALPPGDHQRFVTVLGLPGGTEPAGAELGGDEPEGAGTGGAESESAESGGAEPGGVLSPGGPPGALSRREPLSPPQLREWFARRTCLRSGAAGAGGSATGGTEAAGAGGAAGVGAGGTGAGATGVTGAAGPGGARTGGTGGSGAIGAGSGDTRRPRPYFVPLLEQFLGLPSSTALTPPFLCPQPDQSQPPLQPASPLPTPSPYTEQTGGLTERREPVSRPASPVRAVCTGRRVPRPHPPPVLGTHHMALRTSSFPQRVPLPSPPASSLADGPDPEFDLARAASPTVPHLLATVVTDPSFESAVASALVTKLVDFAAVCRLDYATALVAESGSACPPSLRSECAPHTDVLENRQEDFECLAAAVPSLVAMLLAPKGDPDAPDIPTPRSYAEAITGPYPSKWQTAMDAEMASGKSTGTYVDAALPPGANLVDGMWIFRVKRPPGSPPAFKARYVARGFRQRQGVDFFQTFSPTPKMTTLRVLLHVPAQRDCELHSLDFNTAFLQGSLHEEI
ncbi:unnamed protein product [Closterium sp. NIES-54]